ncbi:YbjN domain-containing protein [Nevskia ramosa]|uniref:YbjN domain-containing protein n=1 Tax=Nevskia ramosa TaxID=64002 RepID=UPI003D0AA482
MTDLIRTSVSPEDLAEVLRKTGYRAAVAEQQGGGQMGGPQVQSAAQGLGFFIGFGNPLPASDAALGGSRQYVDFAFHCWLNIEGELRPDLVDSWNRGKRFARLFHQAPLLVLSMDVVVAGGVAEGFLIAHCELWDRILQDFIAHLRLPTAAAGAAVAGAAA